MNFKNVLMSTILLTTVSTSINALEVSDVTPSEIAMPIQVVCVAKEGEKMKDSGFLVDVESETVSQFSKAEYDSLGGLVPATLLDLDVNKFTHQRCPMCYNVEASLFEQAFYSFHIDGKNGTLNLSGEGMQGEEDLVVNLNCGVRKL